MMDVTFYRDAVLEIILLGKHIPREVCELRCNFFLRAAHFCFTQTNPDCGVLEPFPPCFFDLVTKQRRYDDLKLCTSNIPADLSQINDRMSLPELTWELLHWIFTNPLDISVVKQSEVSEYLTDQLRGDTKLMSIPYPSAKCLRYKIIHPSAINSTKVFLKHKGAFGSFFAYHGTPNHNFHSIIHRGLRCSLNTRKVYGPGTYLTTFLNTATVYAGQYGSYGCSIRYCVAIVEVIKHPSIKVVNFDGDGFVVDQLDNFNFEDTSSNHHRYYVVNSDDLMRLKHLLVYL